MDWETREKLSFLAYNMGVGMMAQWYQRGQELCAISTNGKFHRVVWKYGKMWYKCNFAVGHVKLSKLFYNCPVTCKNCLRRSR